MSLLIAAMALGLAAQPVPYPADGPQVILEEPLIRGDIDPDRIRPIFLERLGAIQGCYRNTLAYRPGATVRLVAVFFICAGRARSHGLAPPTGDYPMLESCLLEEVSRLRFPSNGHGCFMIEQPFDFQPKSPPAKEQEEPEPHPMDDDDEEEGDEVGDDSDDEEEEESGSE